MNYYENEIKLYVLKLSSYQLRYNPANNVFTMLLTEVLRIFISFLSVVKKERCKFVFELFFGENIDSNFRIERQSV